MARVRCKVVEREGTKTRELLSVSAFRHGVAGEMAVLEDDGVGKVLFRLIDRVTR